MKNNSQKTTEQERVELHRVIWVIADDLRESVDGRDFKNYVLCTMFYRYISENIESHFDKSEHKAGNANFSYASLEDIKILKGIVADTIKQKGFFHTSNKILIYNFKSVKSLSVSEVLKNKKIELK